jgi:glycosyltransferase involved in cell wall biosynthesis
MIKLSIIVPVYNVEKYIRPCIESIFKQGLDEQDFEVIIINDGTEDHSMEVIQDIIDQHKNIIVINQENQGLSVARNNGIAMAKGEYILMPDSDDLLIENSLKPLMDIAIENKVDLIVADFLKMTNEEIELNKSCPQEQDYLQTIITGKELYLNEIIPNEYYVWRTLYKKKFICQNNIHFIPGIFFQDVPFTHESYLKAHKCIRTHRLLNIYRRGHQSVSAPSSFKMKNAHDFCIAIAKSWELGKMDGLSSAIKKRHMDYVYISYINLVYRTLFAIEGVNKKVEVLKYLRERAPDIFFSNGLKQIIASVLFRNAPKLYIILLIFIRICRNHIGNIINNNKHEH